MVPLGYNLNSMGTHPGTHHRRRQRRRRSEPTGLRRHLKEFTRIIRWHIRDVPGPVSLLGVALIMAGLFGLVLLLIAAAHSPGPPERDPVPLKNPFDAK